MIFKETFLTCANVFNLAQCETFGKRHFRDIFCNHQENMFDALQIPGCDFNERIVVKCVHLSSLNSCVGGALISVALCYVTPV